MKIKRETALAMAIEIIQQDMENINMPEYHEKAIDEMKEVQAVLYGMRLTILRAKAKKRRASK